MTEAPTHFCPKCQTRYFAPGECDWCQGVQRVEIPTQQEEQAAA